MIHPVLIFIHETNIVVHKMKDEFDKKKRASKR